MTRCEGVNLNTIGPMIFSSDYLSVFHDEVRKTIWIDLHGKERPICTNSLMKDFYSCAKQIESGEIICDFLVITSTATLGFGLGGDFDFFVDSLKKRNEKELRQYAHDAVEAVYRLNSGMLAKNPVVTIALTRGYALGGGFEMALATDVTIAETSTIFGFPEIRFNLFPGMGGMHFVHQRTGNAKLGEILMMSGDRISAEKAKEYHLIDHVVPDGDGVDFVKKYIDTWSKRINGLRLILNAKKEVIRVEKSSLLRVTDSWANGVMHLSEYDVNHMIKLSNSQKKKRA